MALPSWQSCRNELAWDVLNIKIKLVIITIKWYNKMKMNSAGGLNGS